ncbi:MAG TPA: hypothetical protein VHD90_20555 [Phototrophicaceae bacterium]|nr:hypothetical protein [Phototrophicaceae bacterium]
MLDVALGLIILFTVLSITVSALNELISSFLKRRSKNLISFLESLLTGTNLNVSDIFQETVLQPQTVNGKETPSYIKAADFSVAILDLLNRYPTDNTLQVQAVSPSEGQQIDADRWRAMAQQLPPDAPLRKVMMTTIAQAEDDVKKAQTLLENWFDSSMERVSGLYKAQTQLFVLGLSIILVLLMNIDTITIANSLLEKQGVEAGLSSSGLLNSAVVSSAQDVIIPPSDTTPIPQSTETVGGVSQTSTVTTGNAQTITQIYDTLISKLALPIGWPDSVQPASDALGILFYLLRKIIGLGVTVFAISQGAPFWFDLLNKLTNLRYAGKPPDQTADAQSASSGIDPTVLALINQLQAFNNALVTQNNANAQPSLPLPSTPTLPPTTLPTTTTTPTAPTDTTAIPHDPLPTDTANTSNLPSIPVDTSTSPFASPANTTSPFGTSTTPVTAPTTDTTSAPSIPTDTSTTSVTAPDSDEPAIAPPETTPVTTSTPADTTPAASPAPPPKPATLPGELPAASVPAPAAQEAATTPGALPLDPIPPAVENDENPADQSPNG